jgi:HSP20 family protein
MLPVRVFADRGNGLTSWSRDLDHFFDRVLEPRAYYWLRTDVRQEGDDLIVEVEVPGLKKEDLDITVEDGVLSISAEYKSNVDEEKSNYHVRERRFGNVSRSFHLPSTADAENITATTKEGVLTLRIPTKEEAKPRKITVK